MNLYMVNLNNNTNIYSNIEDIPFEISKSISLDLENKGKISFFCDVGEVSIMLCINNDIIYDEVYANPKPLIEDGFVRISHYNKSGKLHTPDSKIPSLIDTSKKEV